MRDGMRPFTFETSVSVSSAAPPETVFEVVSDLPAHLVWSGERAKDQTFKLLDLESDEDRVRVGTTFRTTGANFNGTFHDRSVVDEVERPSRLVIETEASLERKRGATWNVDFRHTYDIRPEGSGSRITYTDAIWRVNYVPYWLQPWLRPITRMVIHSGDTKQLTNLARLAEERHAGPS